MVFSLNNVIFVLFILRFMMLLILLFIWVCVVFGEVVSGLCVLLILMKLVEFVKRKLLVGKVFVVVVEVVNS